VSLQLCKGGRGPTLGGVTVLWGSAAIGCSGWGVSVGRDELGGHFPSGIYQGRWLWPTEDHGTVGKGITTTVWVEVCAGPFT